MTADIAKRILLFIDIDGVTRPIPELLQPGIRLTTNPVCHANLVAAIEGFAVDVVVTSCWRLESSEDDLRAQLGPLGDRMIGVTPEIGGIPNFYRYREITAYLQAQHEPDQPWVAVDDDAELFPADAPLVSTNPEIGFSRENSRQLRHLLELVSQQNG